jgi:hypothetical protein
MKTCFRILILLSLVLELCALPQHTAMAQTSADGSTMPAELQEAFLAASSKPFSSQGGTYTTEYNGLNYQFTTAGLQAEGDSIQWGISLRGMGRGNQAQDVQTPEIMQTDERLEYRRGVITEWYRDTALGLEQGFTIRESPHGKGGLVLHLDLSTDLEGRLDEDERGISFTGADGQTLRYDNLKVYDANGAELEAKMFYNPAQVVIQVEDRDAAYPITIDPLIYLEQKVTSLDGAAGDNFGYAVAMDGDTALVGAANDDIGANANQGSAYIFVRSGTTWIQQAKLTASDGAASDYFGCAVAISGDTALVSARNGDAGATDQGAAYIFVRSGTIWAQQAKLTASDGAASDVFGWSVALSGDTALVGANWDDVGANANQGSAYVFTRSGTTWTQQQQLIAPDGAGGDNFGISVALSGDTALVGAAYDDIGANADQGSAYIFTRSGATWTQQQKLSGLAGVNYYFGAAVALYGDTALVGAPGTSSVQIFVRGGTTWILGYTHYGPAPSQYGSSVALSSNMALVGAANDEYVLVLERIGSNWFWFQNNQIIASDSVSFAGSPVAISGDTKLVGAPFTDIGANTDQGSAYFYQAYRTDDLAVSVATGSTTSLYPGDTVLLSASVMNYFGTGPTDLVSLTVSLPADLTYVSHTSTLGAFTPSTGIWDVGSIPLGVNATLTIQATANMVATPTKTITFAASTSYVDNNPANNSASLALTLKKKEQALNGGFNTYAGASKIPKYWTAVNFATTDGKDTTAANRKEGTASVKITNTAAKVKTLTQTLSTLSGAAGDPFVFSYWVKGSVLPAAGLCQAQVLFYNGSALVGTKTLACGLTGTFAYKQRTLTFTAPAAYTKVMIKFTFSKASGTVWFDLVSLTR